MVFSASNLGRMNKKLSISNKLSVACWNIQGIKNFENSKMEFIKKDILNHGIYALVETHLSTNDLPINFKGYTMLKNKFRKKHPKARVNSGGISNLYTSKTN